MLHHDFPEERTVNVHNLGKLLNPHRIALVGVTINPNSVGGKVLSNLVGGGFKGVVYPVNPDAEAIRGVPCYPDLASLPKVPDLAIICTAADQVPDLVAQCGERGIQGVIIMSAGFKEVGPEGAALEKQVQETVARHKGMRVLGPNCLGIIVPGISLNASFGEGMPRQGKVAFISQSGALCTSILDWALEEKIGFSHFVSVGNMLDVDFADLIDYLGEDEQTESIILYVESIAQARKFMVAARAFARTKPILVYKAGRFPESAAVAASHTGAMASEDSIYDAVFQRTGMARVLNIGEIFDCAELIGRNKTPRGPRLGIVTNAGGPGVMATDALMAQGGVLAKLADDSLEQLNTILPPFWSHGNPVDVLGDAPAKRFAKATEVVVKDKGVDAVLVILTPQAMTKPASVARAVAKIAGETKKPILAAWLGGERVREGAQILVDAGVATYRTPEQGVGAFMTLVNYARNLQNLYETPRDIPVKFALDRSAMREKVATYIAQGKTILSEEHSKELLSLYGIPVTAPLPAESADEAVARADRMGYPVVLKVWSDDITHKSDVGGVKLGLEDAGQVREAFQQIAASVAQACPEAKLSGVTVQPMVKVAGGLEMILGVKKDPVFGSVIMVGGGGVEAELWGDHALGFPPLNERLVGRMLESLKIWPLLNGYRGRPPLDKDALIEAIMRLSYLTADNPEIQELDINPLVVGPDRLMALDARVVIQPIAQEAKPYAHLALRPYPEEYVSQGTLNDGTAVRLRPIRPEDEPLWLEMLGRCSKESIYNRFRFFFNWSTHEVATRYCYIDYDREMAIVAEVELEGRRALVGVGRLVADPEVESAEYAVLVTDQWQNRGLGGLLTDTCMAIAEDWGIKKVYAQTTSDNPRMVHVFKDRNFQVDHPAGGSVVDVEKELGPTP
nr:bifunctional acetate--CoA ligase family protein/GNAT family N-acetyltransferase [Candidatus Krumholzibacteria bacterium]